MIEQEIMWTALPNGIKDGRMQLSVFVSPRLKTDTPPAGKAHPVLGQFPDLLNWAQRGFDFVVRFDGGKSAAATRVSPDPTPELWQALFNADTYVKSYEFDNLDERFVRSYPVRHVIGFLQQHYQHTAVQSPTAFTPIRQIAQQPNSLLQIGLYEEPSVTTPGPQTTVPGRQLTARGPQVTARGPQARTRGPQITRSAPLRRDAAAAPAAVPSETAELGRLAAARRTKETQLAQELTTRLRRTKAIPPSATPNPAQDFLQVKLFHKALNAPALRNPRERQRAVIQVPEIDFHEMLSTLGDYPELMRRLGLVIDLEIAPPPGLPASTRVWVQPTWQQTPAVTTKNVTPKTKCTVQGGFAAQAKGGELISGMLRLRDPSKPPDEQPYDVVQVDLDGAAQKAVDHADNVIRKLARQDIQRAAQATTTAARTLTRKVVPADAGSGPLRRVTPAASVMRRVPPLRVAADTSETTSLPSMRSGGVSLVRHGRAIQLVAMLRTARVQSDAIKANPSADITLYAEDLTRGYRADVYDGNASRWRTLCARVGRYAFTKTGTTLEIEDEGWISQASTEAADESSDDLHIPESLFRWTGWSLVAPRPGKRLGLTDIPEDYENTDETEFGLAVNYRPVPDSLPRLRFGPQYRLRARAVDLAGNGLTLAQADALMSGAVGQRASSELFRYLRFEPVPSPVTALRQSIKGSPGESLERLVIRSFNDSPPKDTQPSTQFTERHIAAPLGAQLLAEHHGMFDTPDGLDPNAYSTIVQREGVLLVGNDSKEEQAHPEAQLTIPYLPDPLSRGASFLGLPGTAAARTTRVEFSGRWPNAMPFRIKIVEGKAAPSFDAGARVLTVGIPKAEMARVRLSSYLDEEDVRLMGLWGWMSDAGESSTKTTSLLRLSSEGRHWMIAPFREL
ncbi:MAG: hypothetical protein PVH68_08805, partial [Armatimonadota bacterium]